MPRMKKSPRDYRNKSQPLSTFGLMLRFTALGTMLGVIFLILFWVWHTGWPQSQMRRAHDAILDATRTLHFTVNDIVVTGRNRTDREELLRTLGTQKGDAIFSIDLQESRNHLTKLLWVADAKIERHLPSTLYVALQEREPIARWQSAGKVMVIDEQGKNLPQARIDDYANLPLIVGNAGAAREAYRLLSRINEYESIAHNLSAAMWINDRRWDLLLRGEQMTIKLPEGEIKTALARLNGLILEQNIMGRPISAIDLRQKDRFIIEPRPSIKEVGRKKP